jgi:glycerol-3-phosphate responsive antiterminator
MEALDALGISFKELEDGSINVAEDAFPKLLQRLSEGELSSREMDAALQILGMRAGQDMVRGLQGGEQGIKSLMNTIKESEGVVTEASEVYDKQLGERWELIRRQYLVPFMEWMGDKLLTVLENVAAFIETWGPRIIAVFETVSGAIDKVVSAISNVINKTQQLYEGGKNAIVAWGEGIKAGAASAVEAAQGVASRVAGFFVGQSPPPEGPLSMIDIGGQRLIEAWADGMLMAEDYVKNVVSEISGTVVSEMERTNNQVMALETGYQNWFGTLENGLMSAIMGTRELSSVLNDILRQLANSMLQKLLFGGLDGMFGGGLFGGLFHSGGVVGKSSVPMRLVPAGAFAGAPRLHNGLRPDEFPAILQRGETVLPRGADTASPTSVKIVNVLDPSIVGNYLGTPEGEKVIVNIMQRNIRRIT